MRETALGSRLLLLWAAGAPCRAVPTKRKMPTSEERSTSGHHSIGKLLQAPDLPARIIDIARGFQEDVDPAKDNFLDAATAACWGVLTMAIEHPLVATSVNGQNIGHITHSTVPMHLQVSGNH